MNSLLCSLPFVFGLAAITTHCGSLEDRFSATFDKKSQESSNHPDHSSPQIENAPIPGAGGLPAPTSPNSNQPEGLPPEPIVEEQIVDGAVKDVLEAACQFGPEIKTEGTFVTGQKSEHKMVIEENSIIVLEGKQNNLELQITGGDEVGYLCIWDKGEKNKVKTSVNSDLVALYYRAEGKHTEAEVDVKAGYQVDGIRFDILGMKGNFKAKGDGEFKCDPNSKLGGKDNKVEC